MYIYMIYIYHYIYICIHIYYYTYKLKDQLNLINIIEKVCKTRTEKTPAKKLYKSKGQVNKKERI